MLINDPCMTSYPYTLQQSHTIFNQLKTPVNVIVITIFFNTIQLALHVYYPHINCKQLLYAAGAFRWNTTRCKHKTKQQINIHQDIRQLMISKNG